MVDLTMLELQDDGTGTGGLAFEDERLGDFLESIGRTIYDTTPKEINALLIESGIKPLF